MNPRQQGDLGEYSAIEWLASRGYPVFVPIGHVPVNRWDVMLCTRGGNQSWNGLSKRFSSDRCDYLFVLVGDGRRWFIPADVVGGGAGIALGGPKYAGYEVDRGRPFVTLAAAPAG
jgi:hypothetical protein